MNSNTHSMTKSNFLDLIQLLSQFNFRNDPVYKYRAALIMFTVSHKLRPAFGIETSLETYCLNIETCRNSLEYFFRSNSINLGITFTPMTLIYDTDLPLQSLHLPIGEDVVYWIGKLFGYWTPMTNEEIENFTVPRYDLRIEVYYGGVWNWITGFGSLKPIPIDLAKLNNIRRVFDILDIPVGNIEIDLNYQSAEKIEGDESEGDVEQYTVSKISL